MSKKSPSGPQTKTDLNHKANQSNPNRGTPGNNAVYDKVQGNRGRQIKDQRK